MLGLMQNRPLLISSLVDYAATWHSEREIVSRDPDGIMHRSNYALVAARAKRLANALRSLGVKFGNPVATLIFSCSLQRVFKTITEGTERATF